VITARLTHSSPRTPDPGGIGRSGAPASRIGKAQSADRQVACGDEAADEVVFAPAAAADPGLRIALVEALVAADEAAEAVVFLVVPERAGDDAGTASGAHGDQLVRGWHAEHRFEIQLKVDHAEASMRAGGRPHFLHEGHRFKAKNDAMQNQRCIDHAGRSVEAYALTVAAVRSASHALLTTI
jgi:hypothetical protein